MPKISQMYADQLQRICPNICKRYAKEISEKLKNRANICPSYGQIMPKISPRYAKDMVYISCTLRSGLHEIPTMNRTFPHGLEYNQFSDNFPGMLKNILFLENCLKSVCLYGCSPIHVERSFFFIKL